VATNKNNPQGFSAIGPVLSAMYFNKNTSAAVYPGDVVGLRADGIAIAAAAGSTEVLGISQSYATSAYKTILVSNDPDQNYYVQMVGVTGFTRTLIGNNADHVATVGNATFLRSRHKLNFTGAATTSATFRILGIHPNDVIGATTNNPRVRVVVNEHGWAKKLLGV